MLVKISLISSAVVAVFFVALGFLPETGWWGINHLYFYSDTARIIFAILIVCAFVPLIANGLQKGLGKIGEFSRGFSLLATFAAPTILLIVFHVAVYSLGDGYQRSFEIESGYILKATELLDHLIHAMLYELLRLFGPFRAATGMAATSIIAGIVFVYWLVYHNPLSGKEKSLVVLSVLSLGSSQLFFGYVESYTLVYLFGIWYVFLALRKDRLRNDFTKLTVIYLLAGFSHVIGIILLPSYFLLAIRNYREKPKRIYKIAGFWLVSLLPLLGPQLLRQFMYMGDSRKLTDYLLPLNGRPYSILSPVHLFDVLNQFLLVAPIMVMILPFIPSIMRIKENRILAASISLPAILFVFVINPELSLARDWDLFALPVALSVVPLLILIFRHLMAHQRIAIAPVISIIVVSMIIQSSWILINSDHTRHLARAEYVLDHAVRAQRYGYEMLAYYYSINHDYENEFRILNLIKPLDRTARVYGKMAQALYLLDRNDEAYRYALKGARMPNPDRLNAIMAGLTAYDKANYFQAIYYLRIAAQMDADDPQWLCKLGDAYTMVDSLDEAVTAYTKAMAGNSAMPCSYFGTATIYYKRNDFEKAEQYCREGLRRDPNSAAGRELLNEISNQK